MSIDDTSEAKEYNKYLWELLSDEKNTGIISVVL